MKKGARFLRGPALWLALCLALCLVSGCMSKYDRLSLNPWTPSPEVFEHWWEYQSYYALLEITESCVQTKPSPATKRDVLKYLGPGIDNPKLYPHAGPGLWVYMSTRRTPYGANLLIYFDENDKVLDVMWLSD